MNLASFDAFTKVDDAFLGRSTSGAYVSIAIWIVLAFLAVSEVHMYLRTTESHEFSVESPVRRSLVIALDMTVMGPCEKLSLKFKDQAGVEIETGDMIQKNDVIFSTANSILHVRKPASPEDKFIAQGSENLLNLLNIVGENFFGISNKKNEADKSKKGNSLEACRFSGRARLLRFATVMSISATGGLGNLLSSQSMNANFSHRIDSMSFGSDYNTIQILDPLARSLEISSIKFETFEYFLSVVPTTVLQNGRVFAGSQYAVTENTKILNGLEIFEEHGITFKLSHEPISITITKERKQKFFRFIVRLCGIVGGVYVCVGILHSLITTLYSSMFRSKIRYVKI